MALKRLGFDVFHVGSFEDLFVDFFFNRNIIMTILGEFWKIYGQVKKNIGGI